jgi:hypothetical protein
VRLVRIHEDFNNWEVWEEGGLRLVMHGVSSALRGQQAIRAAVYDPESYVASQALGEAIRAAQGAGLIYDSVRHAGGVNVVAHRPRNVLDVVQADHFEIVVEAASKQIKVTRAVARRTKRRTPET